jgi:hypothetical protein
MDIIMDIKEYLFMICKDIFFHARFSSVYPFISFMSSNFLMDIQLFIRLYPSFYPLISNIFIRIYLHLIQPFYPFVSCYFIPVYPDIYPAGYSIRFSADPARRGVLLNRTLFCISCSAIG